MKLPVFPLPIFLLPNGVTRLRIFEPRYLRLVSIACKEQGFALCVFDNNSELNVPNWGVWVDVINFYNDGELLHIDIQAKSLLTIENVTMDQDKLRFAHCTKTAHWPVQSFQHHHKALAEKLKNVYQEFPDQAALYPTPHYDNPNWVCARFLEILPLSFEKKKLFTEPNSFSYADEFLQTMLLGKEN